MLYPKYVLLSIDRGRVREDSVWVLINEQRIHRSSVAVADGQALMMGWNYGGSGLRPTPDWIAEATECEEAHPGLVVLGT
jgi:hypothetical protein